MHLVFHDATGLVEYRCDGCGTVHTLALDPAKGDVRVNAESRTLSLRACETYWERTGTHVSVHLNLAHMPYEAGEGTHPGSRLGAHDPMAGTVVIEHVEGYHLLPERVAYVQTIRRMLKHPHLAPHAPLEEDYRAQRAAQAQTAAGRAAFTALDCLPPQ
jgi:hypothetical protein